MVEKFCVHYFALNDFGRGVLLRKEKTRVLSHRSTKHEGVFLEVWETPAAKSSDGFSVWTKAHRAEIPCPEGWL